ncbi:hypothetical protein [Plantactinospora sp. WMMB782]|uniref:hypothetical protein n=1 Tax=Plantactinospora sp. WMMB782 TaxID=3404121 RepID=UPI003B9360AF
MAEQVGSLAELGWLRLDSLGDDPLMRELLELRESCARNFTRLMTAGRPDEAELTSTGQYGFTRDGDESAVALREVRSHLVINQALPESHPLAFLVPTFYGDHLTIPGTEPWLADARRLHRVLDLLTLETMERIEEHLGLSFGAIAGPMAMGERLLRFQWYPALPAGTDEVALVDVDGGRIPVGGRLLADGGRRSRVVRVGPHRDMGHWTWQVHSTDSQLRFWDHRRQVPVPVPRGDWIYGNVCEFLEIEHPRLHTPIHWVDADGGSGDVDRMSISYFAHVRPGVSRQRLVWGVELYRRLAALGYATDADVEHAARLVARRADDPDLILATLDWELANPAPVPGFAAGVSRYYRRRPGGGGAPALRDRADAGSLRDPAAAQRQPDPD